MTEPIWNWQTKVNRLRGILEENALERTFDIGQSSASDLTRVRTVSDINVSAESQWSTPTNISESLVKFINYSDFEENGEMNGVSPVYPVGTGPTPSKADVIDDNERAIVRRTVNSLCDVTTTLEGHDEFSNKCSIECNGDIDSHSSFDIVNCIPVLEVAKANIVALIDDHIAILKNKAQSIQDEQAKQFKLSEIRKTVERRNHIQRIREEIITKMDYLNKLLDDLEKI